MLTEDIDGEKLSFIISRLGGSGMMYRGYASLCLEIDSIHLTRFFQILQGGFLVRANLGCSIRTFLCEQMGLNPEYVMKRILTVFLDGRPVDDLDSANLRDGSVLALSSSVPGLVGATLRRGSILASFRETITHKENESPGQSKEGAIHIKLFNLVIRELGPDFLEKGILVKSSHMIDFTRSQPEGFWEKCKKIILDEKPIKPEFLKSQIASLGDLVYLKVIAAGGDPGV